MTPTENWSNAAIYFFLKCVNEATAVYFRPSRTIFDDDIKFGDLIICRKGKEPLSLSHKLCKLQCALAEQKSGRFLNVFNRSTSAIINRWDDNAQSKKILEHPDDLEVTDIGDSAQLEAAKLRQKTIKEDKEAAVYHESLYEINRSIQKVNDWHLRNAGVEAEVPVYDEVEESVEEKTVSTAKASAIKLMKPIRAMLMKYEEEQKLKNAGKMEKVLGSSGNSGNTDEASGNAGEASGSSAKASKTSDKGFKDSQGAACPSKVSSGASKSSPSVNDASKYSSGANNASKSSPSANNASRNSAASSRSKMIFIPAGASLNFSSTPRKIQKRREGSEMKSLDGSSVKPMASINDDQQKSDCCMNQ
jgi:hypothetical protein